MMAELQQDIWSRWLLNRRFGGDPERLTHVLDYLYPVRDKVLSHINVEGGRTLLDVGCGDGLIAFGALEKFESCRVIFSDISDDLLQHVQALARNMRLEHRSEFVRASADDLGMFEDESVDAVTTRSVLIYVYAKQQAFKEFHRVLKPGGQLSIFEPINRFAYPEPEDRFSGYDVTPISSLAQKLKAVYRRIQPPDTDPMTDFDERDLVNCAEKAGFSSTNVELQIEVKPPENSDWLTFLHAAANPKVPSVEEAMQQAFTLGETETFTSYMRPLVESKQGVRRSAVAYLWAVK
ncbi:MAG TPA: class I SAM-dependent methyltransferase [Anaerolineales bacterium]|nr:class I SAM-dependent methyltransferase [Anaerolineales bacterium]